MTLLQYETVILVLYCFEFSRFFSVECYVSCRNSSIYSADLSTNSTCANRNVNKIAKPRLQERLQTLGNGRRVPEIKPESPQPWIDEDSEPTANARVRKKRSRRQFKKLRRMQLISPSRLQLLTIAAFLLLYFPPWLLLVLGTVFPMKISLILPLFRVTLNFACCVHPIVCWLRHPRLATRLVRFRRKILPSNETY